MNINIYTLNIHSVFKSAYNEYLEYYNQNHNDNITNTMIRIKTTGSNIYLHIYKYVNLGT